MKSNIPDQHPPDPELTVVEKKAKVFVEHILPDASPEERENVALGFCAGSFAMHKLCEGVLKQSPEERRRLMKIIGYDLDRYMTKTAVAAILSQNKNPQV